MQHLAVVAVVVVVVGCGSVDKERADAAVPCVTDDAGQCAAPDAPGCTDDVDCGTDKLCQGGQCVPGECRYNNDCAFPSMCINFFCSLEGTGVNGPLSVPAGDNAFVRTTARVTAINGSTLTTANVSGLGTGDEVMLINLQGSPTDFGSVGNRELFTVFSSDPTTSTVLLSNAPKQSYGANNANTDLTGQTVYLIAIPHFTTVSIAGRLISNRWGMIDGTGVIAFRATGEVTIASGGSIDVNGAGFHGGDVPCNGVSGRPGEAILPAPPLSAATCVGWDNPDKLARSGGGGGALSDCNTYGCTVQDQGAGGGGAGYGTAGTAGTSASAHMGGDPGQPYGSADLTKLFLGSGGGAGSGGKSGQAGTSTYMGNGGGIVVIAANTISIAGTISADGDKGGENNNCALSTGSGSGGGGSGGSIHLLAPTIGVTGAVSAIGGAGGCIGGGAGGVGRIRVDCTSCPSTLVTPAPYVSAL